MSSRRAFVLLHIDEDCDENGVIGVYMDEQGLNEALRELLDYPGSELTLDEIDAMTEEEVVAKLEDLELPYAVTETFVYE